MIDQVIIELIDEIAVEGEQGCTFDQMFTFVESLSIKSLEHLTLTKPILFDNNYKTFIWLHIRNNDQLIFSENETVIDPLNLTFDEMQAKSKSGNLVVKSTEESQDRNIYGSLWAEKKTLADNHKMMLGIIAKSRYQGISQIKLGETLGWDSKVVFYYLKKLEQLGLIVKESVYADHRNTRIIILKKFKKNDEIKNENDVNVYRIGEFESSLLKLLKGANEQMMSLQDAIKSMGFKTEQKIRWARVQINKLHNQGAIEKINAFDGKMNKQSVRLPRPNEFSDTEQEAQSLQETVSPPKMGSPPEDTKEKKSVDTFYRDMSADYQFYQHVIAAGEKGIVRQELVDKYPQLDPHLFQLFFESAATPPKTKEYPRYWIYRTEELEGKTRIFRYFAWDGWKKYNENLGKVITDPVEKISKAHKLVEPPSIDHVGISMGIAPSTKIPLCRLKKGKKARASSDDDEPTPKTQRKRVKKSSIQSESDDIESPKRASRNSQKTMEKLEIDESTETPSMPDAYTTGPTATPDMSAACTPMDTLDMSKTCMLDTAVARKRNLCSEDEDNACVENEEYELIRTSPPPLKVKKRKMPAINITKSRRCGILLDMMETQRIREVDKATIDEFNAIETALAGGQKMATATFNKMIKQLHDQKKLKLYITTIQKPYGVIELKSLLLHPTLSEDSEEVKLFIDSYSVEKPMMSGRHKRKEFKTVEVARLPSIEEEAFRCNKSKDSESEKTTREYNTKYGWIKSKWIRSRIMHETLIRFYNASNTNDNVVDTTEFIKQLSIDTLVIICSGLPYFDDSFRAFLNVQENRAIVLSALPQNIRLLIFKSKLKIRYVINYLLRTLQALGVVEPIYILSSKTTYAIAPQYKLFDKGVIRDYAFKDRAIVATLPLNTVQDVNHFWDELYSVCVNPVRYRSDQEDIDLEKCIDKNDPLRNIHYGRGWASDPVLTPEQKELLDSFVNMETRTIPSDSIALRIYLIKKTKLPAKRIRAYYLGILGALEKQKTKEEKLAAAQQKLSASAIDPTVKDLMLASFQGRKVDTLEDSSDSKLFIRSTFIGSRRFRRLRIRVEPFQGQEHSTRPYSSRPKHNFSELEKDLLLYSYCIMQTRAKQLKFYWGPVMKVLTTRSKEQCRRVFNTMMVNPHTRSTIEKLKCQWEKYYKEGIESQQIVDEKVWDTCDFDLCSYVEYFILRMQEDAVKTAVEQACPLPRNLKDLQNYYHINRNDLLIKAEKDTNLFSVSSMDQNIYDTPTMVTELQNGNAVQLAITLIKMFLTTPDHLYDSKLAHEALGQYLTHDIELALERLRADGLIIVDNSRYSRIPGRAFNVSEKFLRISEGVSPFGIFDDARAYHSTIATKKYMDLYKMNSGMAVSIFNLLFQKKIILRLKHYDKFIKAKESLFYPKASADHLCLAYINKHLDLVVQDAGVSNNDLKIHLGPKAHVAVPTLEQVAVYVKKLDQSDTCFTVYNAVKSLQVDGGSLDDIKLCVNKESRIDERDISKAVYNLVHHNPPLIHVVGFKQLRYICTEFSHHWFLKTHNDKTFLVPLMWNDASGEIIESALDGCKKAVISHILAQPGISHANLRKKFEGFFTEYELYTLLKHLVNTNVIHSKKIQRGIMPAKPSIFYKRPLRSLAEDGVINCNEITFYWLSNDYYFK